MSSLVAPLQAPLRTVLAFSLAINLALLAPSVFMLQVFDRVLTTRSVETLVVMGVMALATLALMGVLDYYRSRVLGGIGLMLEATHGAPLLSQLLRGAARAGGQAHLHGLRDLATVRAFLSGPGVVALCDAPWTVVYLGLIYLFHPALGWLATALTAALVLLAWLNERLTRGLVDQLGERGRQSNQWVVNALRQSETIAAMGLQPALTARWQALNRAHQAVQLAHGARSAGMAALSRVGRQVVQVLMLGYGAYLVIHEHATPGVMLATTIILARALAPVEMLIGHWRSLIEARAALGRLRGLLAGPLEGAVPTALPRPAGRLTAERLGLTAPGSDRALLRDIGFDLAPGQVLAIIGASGSGKSTLARLLAGITLPDSGTVRLEGHDLRAWDPERLGGWIGYVPQDVALFDGTVADNIARMGPADADGVLRAGRQAHVHEMLMRLPQGYDTVVGEAGVRLSGGQRQQVALARALYGDPLLLVLDEPDASLDAQGEQALLAALRDCQARGTTVVVVTQRRAVLAVANTVLVLKDGAIERMAHVETEAQHAGGGRSGP